MINSADEETDSQRPNDPEAHLRAELGQNLVAEVQSSCFPAPAASEGMSVVPVSSNEMECGCGHPGSRREAPNISAPEFPRGETGKGRRCPTWAAAPVLLVLAVQDQGERHQQDAEQAGQRHHQEEPPLLVERGLHLS